MGAATGLVGGLGALTRKTGPTGLGEGRRSTGLAGGPVPTRFGHASGAMGFCGEQGVKWTARTHQLLSGTLSTQERLWGSRAQRGTVMSWSSTAVPFTAGVSEGPLTLGGPGSPLGAGVSGKDSGAVAGAPWPVESSPGPGERWGC